jgi:hypothetical protein
MKRINVVPAEVEIHTLALHAANADFGSSVWIPTCAGTTVTR